MAYEKKDNKNLLRQYAAMGTQFLAAIGISVFVGLKLDQRIKFSIPLLVWILPLLMLMVMLWKILKATSSKNEKTKP